MHFLIILLILIAALSTPNRVHSVIDGDTVRLGDGRTMRLAGIDCPESKHNVKCLRAGADSCDLEVERGQTVTTDVRTVIGAEEERPRVEVIGKDRYGRELGYVWLSDGTDLGQWLVETGRCADWSDRYPHSRADVYRTRTN